MRIAAVVVLYEPSDDVLDNIGSYISDVEVMYAVDNSVSKNTRLVKALKSYPTVRYIDNKGNKGIAHALNVGAGEAMREGYDFLLTMDQDSRAGEGMIPQILTCLSRRGILTVGILSPFHASPFHLHSKENGCIEKKVVMTSGNLLSLKAYAESGPFQEDLFLDYVDNEYCLRLQRHGYKVIQVSEAILVHKLGELSKHKLFGKNIYCYNYPPIRYYYRTRNVIVLHGKLDRSWGTEILRDMVKIILYEKNRIRKLQYMYYGIVDAVKGKMGKYGR